MLTWMIRLLTRIKKAGSPSFTACCRSSWASSEPAKIWRDEKLTGNDVYDDKIVNEFKNAKVMISVLSPRYIKSEWCNRELNEFYNAAENEAGVPAKNPD